MADLLLLVSLPRMHCTFSKSISPLQTYFILDNVMNAFRLWQFPWCTIMIFALTTILGSGNLRIILHKIEKSSSAFLYIYFH